MFKVGDKIKLKKYEPFGDYSSHLNEVATIVDLLDGSMPYKVKWSDSIISHVGENNAFRVNQEWDDEINR